MDEMFKLFDNELLITDNAVHHVANRNDADQSVEECMAVMTEKAVRHLPVLERGRLVGIVSIGDMVNSVIGDQKFLIEELEHFIHGDR